MLLSTYSSPIKHFKKDQLQRLHRNSSSLKNEVEKKAEGSSGRKKAAMKTPQPVQRQRGSSRLTEPPPAHAINGVPEDHKVSAKGRKAAIEKPTSHQELQTKQSLFDDSARDFAGDNPLPSSEISEPGPHLVDNPIQVSHSKE